MLIETLEVMVDQEAVDVSEGVGRPHHPEAEVIEIVQIIPNGIGQETLVIELGDLLPLSSPGHRCPRLPAIA